MAYRDKALLEDSITMLAKGMQYVADFSLTMSATERVTLLYSLLMTAKRTHSLTCNFCNWANDHALDGPFPDILELVRNLYNGKSSLELYCEYAIGVDSAESFKDTYTEHVRLENEKYAFSAIRKVERDAFGRNLETPLETTEDRMKMLGRYKVIWEELTTITEVISDKLESLQKERKMLFKRNDQLEIILRNSEKSYLGSDEWTYKKQEFTDDIKSRLHDSMTEGVLPTKNSYIYLLGAYENNAARITKEYLSGRLLDYLRNNYDSISEEVLDEFFCQKKCIELLQLKIDSFDWMDEPAGTDAKICSSQAAMDIVLAVTKIVADKIMLKGNQYAALKMAFEDLRLTYPRETNNTTEWIAFVNKEIRKPKNESEIKDNGTITKITSKLLCNRFMALSPDDLSCTNFEIDDFSKQEQVYRLAVHITNLIIEKNLEEEGFNHYWLSADGLNIEQIEIPDQEILKKKASVLRGEVFQF